MFVLFHLAIGLSVVRFKLMITSVIINFQTFLTTNWFIYIFFIKYVLPLWCIAFTLLYTMLSVSRALTNDTVTFMFSSHYRCGSNRTFYIKKKAFKFYIIVSFKTTIQYMYLTGSWRIPGCIKYYFYIYIWTCNSKL